MGFITWVAVIAIVLVAIGLGVGVFFSGLFRGAEIVGERLQDNEAVQQAQDEVEDFVGDQITGTSSETLVMTTNEATYDVGEPVTITVKNIGDRTLEFPDASLGLEIENTDTGERYSVISAQVITELEPDESKDITWDEEAPEGDYVATVETTDKDVSAQVEFKIR
jgi:uncharacterized membrane protein